jgi:hypothetical protein
MIISFGAVIWGIATCVRYRPPARVVVAVAVYVALIVGAANVV